MPDRHFSSVMLPSSAQHSPEPPAQGHSSDQSEQKYPEDKPSHAAPFPLSIYHCQASIIEHLHPQFHTAISPCPCKLAVHLYLQTHVSAGYLLLLRVAEMGEQKNESFLSCWCMTKCSGSEAGQEYCALFLMFFHPISQYNTSTWCYCCCLEFLLFVCIIYTFISFPCEPSWRCLPLVCRPGWPVAIAIHCSPHNIAGSKIKKKAGL